MDCLFCKIVDKEIPADIVHEDESTLAFRDINPQAPVHVLVIPKTHVESAMHLDRSPDELIARCFAAAREVARSEGIGAACRIVTNCGSEAGQSVFHLHLHVLGGRPMRWPPG